MNCKKQETSKYISRPSPPFPANECCGQKKKGNDGMVWESKPASNGVCRWVKKNDNGTLTTTKRKSRVRRRVTDSNGSSASKGSNTSKASNSEIASQPKSKIYLPSFGTKKKFYTLDNGGRPFLVEKVSPTTVNIYKEVQDNSDDDDDDDKPEFFKDRNYSKLVKRYTDVDQFIMGVSPLNKATKFSGGHGPSFNGNSILLKLKSPANRYVFIGHVIYEFTSPEPITHYYSSVGNNAVPYPNALSDNHVYFMLPPGDKGAPKAGGEMVPKSVFSNSIDWSEPYSEYYDMFHKIRDYNKRKQMGVSPFKNAKQIHKGVW